MDRMFERVVIENIYPRLDCGQFPIKRVVGEKVEVSADVFAEGTFLLGVNLLWKSKEAEEWERVTMLSTHNDRWFGDFTPDRVGIYMFTIEAWIDYFATWSQYISKKVATKSYQTSDAEPVIQFLEAIRLDDSMRIRMIENLHHCDTGEKVLEYLKSADFLNIPKQELGLKSHVQSKYVQEVSVKRKKALFSTWYELFPRSASTTGQHGTFADCIELLPHIAKMGFDVLYLPPIHPIGKRFRKGPNNSLADSADAPGCPWAIGSQEGGHDTIHPQLGTIGSFKELIAKAAEYHIEIALDLALQCSPDHPYLRSNPQWFQWRADGTVHYAENPPKKYEDIVPFYFDTADWENLWFELKRLVVYWVDQGVKIFRVDNPHTKPFAFWEWLIKEVNEYNPDVLFLSEAFTRPKVMQRLAKIGFDQSYTYFTWRNNKYEMEEYIKELVTSDLKEYFRPNFWPNTPDILPEALQYGGRAAFIARYILAATLSSNCGIYGPLYELCENRSLEGKEEYLDSEKYEIRSWSRSSHGTISEIITLVNAIRKENRCLQTTSNIQFINTENDKLIAYLKKDSHSNPNILLIIVNFDFYNTQSGMVHLPLEQCGLSSDQSFLVHDQITDEKYIWTGSRNYVELNPHIIPAHILKVQDAVRQENNFDYYL